jgi:hypothetical protein
METMARLSAAAAERRWLGVVTVPRCRSDTYVSSIFMVNGFEPANELNAAGFPSAPSVARPTLLAIVSTTIGVERRVDILLQRGRLDHCTSETVGDRDGMLADTALHLHEFISHFVDSPPTPQGG